MLQSSSTSTSTYSAVYSWETQGTFCSMYLRNQYASCVCMLICHYTHSLLANMLALISSCRFICWLVYCFSVTAVASLLTCAIWEFDLCNIDNIAQVSLKALGSWLIWDFNLRLPWRFRGGSLVSEFNNWKWEWECFRFSVFCLYLHHQRCTIVHLWKLPKANDSCF